MPCSLPCSLSVCSYLYCMVTRKDLQRSTHELALKMMSLFLQHTQPQNKSGHNLASNCGGQLTDAWCNPQAAVLTRYKGISREQERHALCYIGRRATEASTSPNNPPTKGCLGDLVHALANPAELSSRRRIHHRCSHGLRRDRHHLGRRRSCHHLRACHHSRQSCRRRQNSDGAGPGAVRHQVRSR